jgi:O-antigen ligase
MGLFLIVFFIPMQARWHRPLRPWTTYLINIDISFPLYFEKMVFYCLSDILILVLLILLMLGKKSFRDKECDCRRNQYFFLFFVSALISLLLSHHSHFGLQYFRLLQLLSCGMMIVIVSYGFQKTSSKATLILTSFAMVLSSIFQSFIAITQYFSQKPLGLKRLGEINFAAAVPCPSSIWISDGSRWIFDRLFTPMEGHNIARAYGTFADPNILGGFMFFSILCSMYLFLQEIHGWIKKSFLFVIPFQMFALFITYSRSAFFSFLMAAAALIVMELVRMNKENQELRKVLLIPIKQLSLILFFSLCFCVTLLYPQLSERGGFLLTGVTKIFSLKGAVVAFPFLLFFFARGKIITLLQFLKDNRRVFVVVSGLLLASILYVSMPVLKNHFYDEGYKNTVAYMSDQERVVYQNAAFAMIRDNPFFGVGFNNFSLEMKKYTNGSVSDEFSHPVHNIFLLITSEMGLIGLFFFCFFIGSIFWSMARRGFSLENATLIAVFIGYIFIGGCSHYLLTWQNGRLMFFLLLGLIHHAGIWQRRSLANVVSASSKMTI